MLSPDLLEQPTRLLGRGFPSLDHGTAPGVATFLPRDERPRIVFPRGYELERIHHSRPRVPRFGGRANAFDVFELGLGPFLPPSTFFAGQVRPLVIPDP